MCFGKVRLEPQCLSHARRGFFGLAQYRQHHTQARLGIGIIRPQLQRAAVASDRLPGPVLNAERVAKIKIVLGSLSG